MQHAPTFGLAQRIVLVVALAAALDVGGVYATTIGAGPAADFGWFGYAPLTRSSPLANGGMPMWARLLIWLGLIAVWTVVSLRLLGSRRAES